MLLESLNIPLKYTFLNWLYLYQNLQSGAFLDQKHEKEPEAKAESMFNKDVSSNCLGLGREVWL